MSKRFVYLFTALVAISLGVTAQEEEQSDLIYVAVDPCRIADTRQSSLGVIRADTTRNVQVAGSLSELASQGGTQDCLNPKSETPPAAVAVYILAVPANSSSRKGVLTAYPSNQDPPPPGTGSTVNFDQDQVIGNTTIVKVCESDCPADGELAVLSRQTDEHVVVDIQGYFYRHLSIPGYERRSREYTSSGSLVDFSLQCPDGKRALGGGARLSTDSSGKWALITSYPYSVGWTVAYSTFDGQIHPIEVDVYAVCAYVDR